MTTINTSQTGSSRLQPPSKHELAFMIWLCVFPTLAVINIALAGWLETMPALLRTFVLATVAVPVVMYGLMPRVHRLRGRLHARAARS